jgi:hypothetical protein
MMKGAWIMSLTRKEQETVISYDRSSQTMSIHTADPFLMARLDKLSDIYKKVGVHQLDALIVAADYQADKSLLTLRNKKPVGRKMSEAEKKAAVERLAKARAQKSILKA